MSGRRTDLTVLPGFIDIHTHIDDRIGPFTLADDAASGTRCAVQNGVTTLYLVTESVTLRPIGILINTAKARNTFCDCFATSRRSA
jgi:adenine deaminase